MPNKSSKGPDFKSESEEAAWYTTPEGRRQTQREFERALKNGTLRRSPGEKVKRTDPAVLQALMEQAKAKATRLIALRIPILDVERAEAVAERRGVGYQAILKEAIRTGLDKAK